MSTKKPTRPKTAKKAKAKVLQAPQRKQASPKRIKTEVVKDLPALLKRWRAGTATTAKRTAKRPRAAVKKPKAKVLTVLEIDKLHTCPACHRKGFTRAGLARHACRPFTGALQDKTPVLTLTPVAPPRLCAHCGTDISHRRKQANTCGLSCRVALARSK